MVSPGFPIEFHTVEWDKADWECEVLYLPPKSHSPIMKKVYPKLQKLDGFETGWCPFIFATSIHTSPLEWMKKVQSKYDEK